MTRLILTSPLRGWAMPLDAVPDPVFADRMLGDGAAIDPTGSCLHAPCDGIVLSVHAARHAVTLRADEGAEILMHIGIDTVALGGDGFTAHVVEGQAVRRGDPLVSFDLDRLLDRARAVVTPILLTNPDAFAVVRRHVDMEIGVGQALLVLEPRTAGAEAMPEIVGDTVTRRIAVPMVHGIHARPAARITACARDFRAEASVAKDDRTANARSATALLALGVRFEDVIEIAARGDDAAEAVDAIAALIAGGMGEGATAAPAPASPPPAAPPPASPSPVDGVLAGIVAAPGLAVGKARRLVVRDRDVAADGASPAVEHARLKAALATVRARLASDGAPAADAIRAAHVALVEDPDLIAAAGDAIDAGRSADHAWRQALRAQAAVLRALGDPRLAERADDLLDIERQTLAELAGEQASAPVFAPGTILVADDLLPSDVAALDPATVLGLCTARGGPTSHVAILAAGMGLPALVAMGAPLAAVEDGTALILDAAAGTLTLDPDAEAWRAAQAAVAAAAERRTRLRAAAADRATTRDGVRIEAFANLASVDDARVAVANGAEGCGLLRTEFLFLDRADPPGEAEQAADYQAIADALNGRPLIVRLLDIGGDKPAPYLPIAAEENPALGLRGIRVGLQHPALLAAQLRAILSVRPIGACRIMVPMVASLAEFAAVRTALDAARAETGHDGRVELGIMVETPAAAITADLFATQADFLSIGSNDLTQYVLAMDRGNPAVAAGVDGLHPAVLRLIGETCRGAARHGRWTGVCGGLASDPLAVPILIGLGVTELSATPALVPEIKAAIRAVSMADCRDLAERVVALSSAAEVRRVARAFQAETA